MRDKAINKKNLKQKARESHEEEINKIREINNFNKFLMYAEYTNICKSAYSCLKPNPREYMLSPLNPVSNNSGDDIIHMNRFSQCRENPYPEICIVCSTPPFNSRSHPVISKECSSRNSVLEVRKVSLCLSVICASLTKKAANG